MNEPTEGGVIQSTNGGQLQVVEQLWIGHFFYTQLQDLCLAVRSEPHLGQAVNNNAIRIHFPCNKYAP